MQKYYLKKNFLICKYCKSRYYL